LYDVCAPGSHSVTPANLALNNAPQGTQTVHDEVGLLILAVYLVTLGWFYSRLWAPGIELHIVTCWCLRQSWNLWLQPSWARSATGPPGRLARQQQSRLCTMLNVCKLPSTVFCSDWQHTQPGSRHGHFSATCWRGRYVMRYSTPTAQSSTCTTHSRYCTVQGLAPCRLAFALCWLHERPRLFALGVAKANMGSA
jgi:hypothetical protein